MKKGEYLGETMGAGFIKRKNYGSFKVKFVLLTNGKLVKQVGETTSWRNNKFNKRETAMKIILFSG